MSRSPPLNVVISREGSLSPRSRSGSASPCRSHHEYADEDRIPQQVNYQDVVVLFRKWQDSKVKVAALEDETIRLRRWLGKADKFVREARKSTEIARSKELQAKHKNTKGLLEASMLESARLSRKLATKSRELDEAQHQIAGIPALKSTIEGLMKEKSQIEETLSTKETMLEEEKRRSRLWSDQVDDLSNQVVKSEERCRELTIENSKLGANIERSEGILEQARRRGAEATAMVEELRAAGIEIERLKQELGAVRADCGTLVQLVSSTKEYSYYRQLWDDSGGLTRINNAFHGDSGGSSGGRSMRGIFGVNWISSARETYFESSVDDGLAPTKVGSIESSERLSRNSTMRAPEPNVTLPPPPPPPSLLPPKKKKLRRHQEASVTGTIHSKSMEASKEQTAKAAAAAVWDEAMRSEWSSPAEKIIIAALLTSKAEAAAEADDSNKSVSRTADRRGHKASSGGKEQVTTQRQWVKRGKLGGDSSGKGRITDDLAKPSTFVEGAIGTAGSLSCGKEVIGRVRSDSRLAPVTVPASGVLATSLVDQTTATATTSSCTSEISPPMEKPGLGDETTKPPGNKFRYNDGGYGDNNGDRGKRDGSCGGRLQSGAREVVQWGRLDLFSVLYPPPRPTGSAAVTNPFEEAFMWVPRETAALCRRFFFDFDAKSALPLDARQRRMVIGLLVRLNTIWRKIERRRVKSVRIKYRAQLATARGRLEMRKPLEIEAPELAAERHHRCPGVSCPTSSAIFVGDTAAIARPSLSGLRGGHSPINVLSVYGGNVRGVGGDSPSGERNLAYTVPNPMIGERGSNSKARYKRRNRRAKKRLESKDAGCCGPRRGKMKGPARNTPSSSAIPEGC